MTDLITALEKAEAGSRELDAMIARHLQWECKVLFGSMHWVTPSGGRGSLPSWTTSIDAAVTLVPPGHDWVLYSDGCAGCAPRDPEDLPISDHYGATPALSLCIAALKARAAIAATTQNP